MSSKKKFLSLEERIKVLKKLDEGQPIRKIAEEFKCGKTQITNICCDFLKDAILLHMWFTVIF
jgi:hypothetical protein